MTESARARPASAPAVSGRVAQAPRRLLGTLAHSRISAYLARQSWFRTSSIISATASAEPWSDRLASTPARRAPASSCRPRRLSTPAQVRATLARSAAASSGTSLSASSSASWPSSVMARRCQARSHGRAAARPAPPPAPSAGAGARHPANQRAALAGARRSGLLPGFPQDGDRLDVSLACGAARRGGRAWRQRPHAPRVPRRTARGHRAASLPPSSRTPPCAPAGAGSGSAAAPRSSERDRAAAARRPPPSLRSRRSLPRPPPAPARTGRPRPPRPRARGGRPRRAAPAPPRATPRPPTEPRLPAASSAAGAAPAARSSDRASCSR